jgi:hypothetical protein
MDALIRMYRSVGTDTLKLRVSVQHATDTLMLKVSASDVVVTLTARDTPLTFSCSDNNECIYIVCIL